MKEGPLSRSLDKVANTPLWLIKPYSPARGGKTAMLEHLKGLGFHVGPGGVIPKDSNSQLADPK